MLIANCMTPPRPGRRDSQPCGKALQEVSAVRRLAPLLTYGSLDRFTPHGEDKANFHSHAIAARHTQVGGCKPRQADARMPVSIGSPLWPGKLPVA